MSQISNPAVPDQISVRAGIRARADRAVAALEKAKQINDCMQKRHPTGTEAWHQHESIDDQLYEALAALGE